MVIYPYNVPSRIGLFALFLIIICSCQKTNDTAIVDNGCISVTAEAQISSTKTTLSDNKLSWSKGDRLGVYIKSAQDNALFTFNADSTFTGGLERKQLAAGAREVYAYYPYVGNQMTGTSIIEAYLPKSQLPPFDSSCDYMVSDVTSVNYNEESMPIINLTFNHHLFSIINVSFINTDAVLSDQTISCVHVESKTKTLSGSFYFDVSDGALATAVFDNSKGNNSNSIDCYYQKDTKIGLNKIHSLSIIVPPGNYAIGDISITVYTEGYEAKVETKKELDLSSGTIYVFETIDFASKSSASEMKKTMLCFGDSITTGTVTAQLQTLLGNGWKVYIAGVSGETVLQIMSRQGIAPLYIPGGFVLPAHQEGFISLSSSFKTTYHTNGTKSTVPDLSIKPALAYYTGNTTYCGHSNPFLVKGVQCELQYSGGVVKICRLEDGEVVDCSGDDYVLAIPCAAWKYGTPTVTSVYMGTNGAYSSNQVLADYYKEMKEQVSPNGFIAVGYHHSSYTTPYKTTMESTLGVNYLNLRVDGCNRAQEIMDALGLRLTDGEKENIKAGEWPSSWIRDAHHPSETGAKAHAYLIYYKMKELHYIE